MFADPKKKTPPLTEDQARKMAEDLRAQAAGGANLADIAKKSSSDFSKDKGGDLGFMPEYRKSPGPMGGAAREQLASNYGDDFATAVHKTANGQLTPVV